MKQTKQKQSKAGKIIAVVMVILLLAGSVGALAYLSDGFRDWEFVESKEEVPALEVKRFDLTKDDKVELTYSFRQGEETEPAVLKSEMYAKTLGIGAFLEFPKENVTVTLNGKEIRLYYIDAAGMHLWVSDKTMAAKPYTAWYDNPQAALFNQELVMASINLPLMSEDVTEQPAETEMLKAVVMSKAGGTLEIPGLK